MEQTECCSRLINMARSSRQRRVQASKWLCATAACVAFASGGFAFGQSCGPATPGANNCDPGIEHGNGGTAACLNKCVGETLDCTATFRYLDGLLDPFVVKGAFNTVHGNVRDPAVGNLPIISIQGNAVCTDNGGACNPSTGANCAFPCLVGPGGKGCSDAGTSLSLPGAPQNGSVRVADRNMYTILVTDVGNLANTFNFTQRDLCDSGCSDCPANDDSATASSSTLVPNCNDNDTCTTDCCSAGVCSHTSDCLTVNGCRGIDGVVHDVPPVSCDDQNVCTTDACVNDKDPATACCSHTPVVCQDDGNPCTHEFCDAPAVGCTFTPDCTVAGDCAPDGLNCTVETCVNFCCGTSNLCPAGVVCCADGASCDDGDACTDDSCSNGCCTHTPHSCPPCFRCDSVLGCVADCRTGALADCCPDDGNPCTHESCNQDTGVCNVPTPDCTVPGDCASDGLNCTVSTCVNSCCGTSDLCPAGVVCCADGASCDDNDACTDDSCVGGCCAHQPHICPSIPCKRNTGCDPVDGCLYVDDCRTVVAGDAGLIPSCCPDDGNACTHEFCDQATGACSATPDCTVPADCDDGMNCTIETCTNSCCGHEPLCPGGECCADGQSCDDGNECTADACTDGCCTHTPLCASDADCGDSNSCTTDRCVAGCCTHTPLCTSDSQCGDGNSCTTDACVGGCCVNTPIVPCCGDNHTQTGESCDGTDAGTLGCSAAGSGATDACRANCTCCGDGIVQAGEECDDGNSIDTDACSNSCKKNVNETCRTPGFWKEHACGTDGVHCEKANSKNLAQLAINECGGCLNVCGDVINNTLLNDSDSVLEAMCVPVKGAQQLQLVRQLTAAALNCCISGKGNACTGMSIDAVFNACNSACIKGQTSVTIAGKSIDCIGALDNFNNGLISDCHDRTLGTCSDGSICTDQLPCEVGSCGAPGPAGSADACNAASGNRCWAVGTSTCATGGANGPQSCP